MIFRSEQVSAHWDTWCYHHEGIYYLYYLITEHSPGEGFGVATSRDGVHWEDHGWAVRASEQMVHFLGTGSVWADPTQEGRFLCNYSEHRQDGEKRRQCILFAWSEDLIHWTKFGDEYTFWIDEEHYERHGRWDCIFALPREEGGYWGTWTATPRGGSYDEGGIGIGFSEDGLNWQALPAPNITPLSNESGAMAEVNGRIHAMFGRFQGETGMHAYVADSLTGPFCLARKNPRLLRAWHTYFSRYFDSPDGILINHHAMNGKENDRDRSITFLAPFKRFTVDPEGIQRWVWWPGNEALKGPESPAGKEFDFQRGVLYEGRFGAPQEAGWPALLLQMDTLTLRVDLTPSGELTVRTCDSEGRPEKSILRADREMVAAREGSFRLLARQGMLEIYLNDMFLECCQSGCPEAQSVQCRLPEGDQASLRAWQMDL